MAYLGAFPNWYTRTTPMILICSLHPEAVWGADPLEAHGGFRTMDYDPEATFPSALGEGGVCRWTTILASDPIAVDGSAKATLQFGFPEINWSFLRSVYGWSGLQYQAWARGNVTVSGSSPVTTAIYADGILEFRIDGELYFGGDFYSYRRAPLMLELDTGIHTVELRLFYDIRALGGSAEPRINSSIEFKQISRQLHIDPTSILTADVVEGKLASSYATVNVQNALNTATKIIWIRPIGENARSSYDSFPGQIPVQFSFEIGYQRDLDGLIQTVGATVYLKHRHISEALKFTFLHPGGIVSYAILRPPLNIACRGNGERSLPLLLGLHGAGLEADGEIVRHMLDGVYGLCAWVLFPTGATTWSGDDWHTWGFADIQAAIAAIPNWMKAMNWKSPGISLEDWIVVGHSNGGQGTWYLLSHQPDKVLAAAPVSGYSSIENYVPFNLWHNAEASLAAVLESARGNFKHELLIENFVEIPILQQHGADDDNVPAYHSRLMHQLTWEGQTMTRYYEIPGAGHWFEGVLTTTSLAEFYRCHAEHLSHGNVPEQFSAMIPSSPDMGSKGGILVDQLWSPDKYGHLDIKRNTLRRLWSLKTRNIRRFHIISRGARSSDPENVLVDGSELPFLPSVGEADLTWYIRNASGHWETSQNDNWRSPSERYGRQSGTLDAILRTKGHLTVVSHSSASDKIALQICRNLFQYFAADCEFITANSGNLLVSRARPSTGCGNLITVAIGDQLDHPEFSTFPISIRGQHLRITVPDRRTVVEYEFETGLGAIFLRPLADERLELVVWGADQEGLQEAARLVPTLTGVGQPDFVVLSTRCRWKGAGGVYAAGFFDYSWQVSFGSYLS
ncbi:hypothetical protein PRK78_001772 [Emydomyces testavorans]|uniref:Peptidase S9 prolyl oligopeptidase catalytic domain-containing protein n=1 Tax=Emydomyces testavorans TaxID=2070801 RepID=A0AAF0DDV1_9EURO|nr:hypothetical protein PRK78_001772 [Emydomyces testavorans]